MTMLAALGFLRQARLQSRLDPREVPVVHGPGPKTGIEGVVASSRTAVSLGCPGGLGFSQAASKLSFLATPPFSNEGCAS